MSENLRESRQRLVGFGAIGMLKFRLLRVWMAVYGVLYLYFGCSFSIT